MNLSEAQEYIASVLNRLTKENAVKIVEQTIEGKMNLVFEFRAPEWFRDLDENIQELAVSNLQNHILDNVKNELTNEHKCCDDDSCSHRNKRLCNRDDDDDDELDLPGWGDEMRETRI